MTEPDPTDQHPTDQTADADTAHTPHRPAPPAMTAAQVAVAHQQGATVTVMCDATCGRLTPLYAGDDPPPGDDPAEQVRVAAGCRDTPLACPGAHSGDLPDGLDVATATLTTSPDLRPLITQIGTLLTSATADTTTAPRHPVTPRTLDETATPPPHAATAEEGPVAPAEHLTAEQVADHLGVDPALVTFAVVDIPDHATPEDPPAEPP